MEQKVAAVFRMKRNIKDTVFTRLFREKKYLLQLYQALHPEDKTTTEEDLKTITLEPIFVNLHLCIADTTYYKSRLLHASHSRNRPDIRTSGYRPTLLIRVRFSNVQSSTQASLHIRLSIENTFIVKDITNDLDFSVKDKLFILAEAQSTASVNIIVRSFMYLAHTYQEHFKETKQNLYRTKPVIIPKPELYVIFSCDTNIDKDVLTLSEQFFGGEEAAIEVRVKVITEKNSKGIIEQYILFAKVLDEQVKSYGYTRKAIDETLRICESYDILKEFLKEHEKEVADIMISLYSQDEIYEMFLHEVKEEGRVEGRVEGEAKGKEDMVIAMLKDNEDISKISKFSHFSLEKINEIKERLLNNVQLANE